MSRTSAERRRERSEWLERAESIGPALADLSEESTRLRTMAPAAVSALEDAGMFAIAVPVEVGGFDVHPATQVEVFEALASYDMSAGWVSFIQTESAASLGAKLPDGPGLQAVFADGIPRAVGLINPQGEARPENGGYRVSGKWNFGSGVRHCAWIIGASRLFDADGNPRLTSQGFPITAGCAIPQSSFEIEDNWDTIGLEGTGSCNFLLPRPVHVSTDYMTNSAAALRGSPWHHGPGVTYISPGHTGVALGGAKRALQLLATALTDRVRMGAKQSIADRGAFQRDYGEALARYGAARAYALDTLDGVVETLEAGNAISPAEDAEVRAMVAWVTDACVQVVRFAHHSSGGAAVFRDHPMQKVYRDITTASQHIYVAETAYERSGALHLNRAPATAW